MYLSLSVDQGQTFKKYSVSLTKNNGNGKLEIINVKLAKQK
jgi:hypothetical protein